MSAYLRSLLYFSPPNLWAIIGLIFFFFGAYLPKLHSALEKEKYNRFKFYSWLISVGGLFWLFSAREFGGGLLIFIACGIFYRVSGARNKTPKIVFSVIFTLITLVVAIITYTYNVSLVFGRRTTFGFYIVWFVVVVLNTLPVSGIAYSTFFFKENLRRLFVGCFLLVQSLYGAKSWITPFIIGVGIYNIIWYFVLKKRNVEPLQLHTVNAYVSDPPTKEDIKELKKLLGSKLNKKKLYYWDGFTMRTLINELHESQKYHNNCEPRTDNGKFLYYFYTSKK